MTETVGGVSYSVDVDYGPLGKLDSKIDEVGKSAGQSLGKVDSAFKKTDASMAKFSKTSGAVVKGIGGVGRSAGQASIQVQQFIGQLQGGQNLFVALSQQSADLGFVLGAPLLGAITSIAAVVGGVLYASMQDGASSVEDLTDKIKKLREESQLTEEQSKFLSEQEKDGLEEKYKTIKSLELEIMEREKLIDVMSREGTGTDRGQFAIPRSAEDNIARYEGAIESARRAIIKNKAEIATLTGEIDKAKESINQYEDGVLNSVKSQKALSQLQEDLALASAELERGEDAAKKLAIAFSLGLTNAEMIPPEILKTVDALIAANKQIEANKKAEREAAVEAKKSETDKRNELRKSQNEFEQYGKKIAQGMAKAQGTEAERALLISDIRSTGLAAKKSADEIQKMVDAQNALFATEDAKSSADKVKKLAEEIRLLEIKGALGNEEYERQAAISALGDNATTGEIEKITALVTKMQELRFEAELLGPTLEQSFSDTMLSSLDQFSRGMADIILSGASAREVFHSLASTIATELLTAIIRYYVGQAAASLLGISTTTAAGVAQAATLTSAYTPAAIAANIATFGAAATAAAATAPLAATATIAAVSSGSLGAGRLYGGPVGGGKLYPFMEDGKPEALEMGGKTYLWTGGGNGNVVSNGEMSKGGASNITVQMNIVNNASGATVESGPARKVSDDKYIVDVVVSNLNERGRIHGAVTGTTTAGNRIS